MSAPPLDLFTATRERRKAEAGHASIVQRLGVGTMAEIHRAFDHCLTHLDSFTAEHLHRELSAPVRDILAVRHNRSVLGAVFRAAAKQRRIERTGELMPAVHAGSRGRLLIVWRKREGV